MFPAAPSASSRQLPAPPSSCCFQGLCPEPRSHPPTPSTASAPGHHMLTETTGVQQAGVQSRLHHVHVSHGALVIVSLPCFVHLPSVVGRTCHVAHLCTCPPGCSLCDSQEDTLLFFCLCTSNLLFFYIGTLQRSSWTQVLRSRIPM